MLASANRPGFLPGLFHALLSKIGIFLDTFFAWCANYMVKTEPSMVLSGSLSRQI
jgi:hypothetical protein